MMSIGTGDSATERGAARLPTTAIFSIFLISALASCANTGIAKDAVAAVEATNAIFTAFETEFRLFFILSVL